MNRSYERGNALEMLFSLKMFYRNLKITFRSLVENLFQ